MLVYDFQGVFMEKGTTDLWFAAYLMLREDIYPERWEKSANGRIRYFYKISDEDWQDYKRKCAIDDITNMKFTIEKLKDMSF